MKRQLTIGMGAALLTLALVAAGCGGGNNCAKACKRVTKCLSPGDAGAAKGDAETPTPYSGTTCGLSETCSPKEAAQARQGRLHAQLCGQAVRARRLRRQLRRLQYTQGLQHQQRPVRDELHAQLLRPRVR